MAGEKGRRMFHGNRCFPSVEGDFREDVANSFVFLLLRDVFIFWKSLESAITCARVAKQNTKSAPQKCTYDRGIGRQFRDSVMTSEQPKITVIVPVIHVLISL